MYLNHHHLTWPLLCQVPCAGRSPYSRQPPPSGLKSVFWTTLGMWRKTSRRRWLPHNLLFQNQHYLLGTCPPHLPPQSTVKSSRHCSSSSSCTGTSCSPCLETQSRNMGGRGGWMACPHFEAALEKDVLLSLWVGRLCCNSCHDRCLAHL